VTGSSLDLDVCIYGDRSIYALQVVDRLAVEAAVGDPRQPVFL
jgi:hypothetical protein